MTEIWKKHPNIDERYEFSNFGNFKNVETNQILKNTINNVNSNKKDKYVITFLKLRYENKRLRFRIHRIVAELFVHNPNKDKYKQVNHIDGNKINNHYSNLEWVDDLINIQHAIDNNLRKYSPEQKLTIEQAILVREEYDTTDITMADLGRKYGVSSFNMKLVLSYKSFGRIEPEKKMNYKINRLTGDELKLWEKTKVSLKNKLKISGK